MSDNINPSHYKRLPVEAIDIIESAIENAPSADAAYNHGQALKYLLRCWHKNGIEDLQKSKWYLDRLIKSLTKVDLADGLVGSWKPELPKPELPDGWRWLNAGEVIRKGDQWHDKGDGSWNDREDCVGQKYNSVCHRPTIRRNRFKAGEKVVRVDDQENVPLEVINHDKQNAFVWIRSKNQNTYCYQPVCLAPYIEDSK